MGFIHCLDNYNWIGSNPQGKSYAINGLRFCWFECFFVVHKTQKSRQGERSVRLCLEVCEVFLSSERELQVQENCKFRKELQELQGKKQWCWEKDKLMQIQTWVAMKENWAGLSVFLVNWSLPMVEWIGIDAQKHKASNWSNSHLLCVCAEQLGQCCVCDLTLWKFVAVLLLLSLRYGFIMLKAFWSLWVIFFSSYCMLFLNELASKLICHRFNYGTQSWGSCFFLILSKELE